MANAQEPLGRISLTADAVVQFSNIPQTFRDLKIVWSVGGTTSTGGGIKFNDDTNYGSNYSRIVIGGNGSSGFGFLNSGGGNPAANHDVSALRTNGMVTVDIIDYAVTTKHKSMVCRQSSSGNDVVAQIGKWHSNAAINTITLTNDSGGALTAGTIISLYGIVG